MEEKEINQKKEQAKLYAKQKQKAENDKEVGEGGWGRFALSVRGRRGCVEEAATHQAHHRHQYGPDAVTHTRARQRYVFRESSTRRRE